MKATKTILGMADLRVSELRVDDDYVTVEFEQMGEFVCQLVIKQPYSGGFQHNDWYLMNFDLLRGSR